MFEVWDFDYWYWNEYIKKSDGMVKVLFQKFYFDMVWKVADIG